MNNSPVCECNFILFALVVIFYEFVIISFVVRLLKYKAVLLFTFKKIPSLYMFYFCIILFYYRCTISLNYFINYTYMYVIFLICCFIFVILHCECF